MGMKQESSVQGGDDLGRNEHEQRFPDCGHPMVLAELAAGEHVLEIGCGAGVDCLLAAKIVGAFGKVVGVEGTPAAIARARSQAALVRAGNISFRLAELEHLPLRDEAFDAVLSNGALSFVGDHRAACREAFRVMRLGGRLAVTEVLATGPLPPGLRRDLEAMNQPTARTTSLSQFAEELRQAGFRQIEQTFVPEGARLITDWKPGWGLAEFLTLVCITAHKVIQNECPNGYCCS